MLCVIETNLYRSPWVRHYIRSPQILPFTPGLCSRDTHCPGRSRHHCRLPHRVRPPSDVLSRPRQPSNHRCVRAPPQLLRRFRLRLMPALRPSA